MANTQSGGAIDDSEYPKIKVSDGVLFTHTGDTALTEAKKYTVPGGLLGANGSLSFKVHGYTEGNNDDKTVLLEFGGEMAASLIQAVNPAATYFVVEGIIDNKQVTNQQRTSYDSFYNDNALLCGSLGDIAVNTENAADLRVLVTLGNAADSIHITHFEVRVLPAG